MPSSQPISQLVALAQEPSSDRRRELLHAVTDLFLSQKSHEATTTELFDVVMTQVSDEVDDESRTLLAERLAPAPHAPGGVVRKLAQDENILVASPILRKSIVLSQDDLIEVAEKRGDDHMVAMSGRDDLGETVTDVLVKRGNKTVLRHVSANQKARFSRTGAETLYDRSSGDIEIQRNLERRQDLPMDLKKRIEQRSEQMTGFGRRGQTINHGAMQSVITMMTEDFSRMTGLEPQRIERMIIHDRMDLLVIIARALDMDEANFERLVRHRCSLTSSMVPSMDDLFNQFRTLPVDAAQRMARFLRVRAAS